VGVDAPPMREVLFVMRELWSPLCAEAGGLDKEFVAVEAMGAATLDRVEQGRR